MVEGKTSSWTRSWTTSHLVWWWGRCCWWPTCQLCLRIRTSHLQADYAWTSVRSLERCCSAWVQHSSWEWNLGDCWSSSGTEGSWIWLGVQGKAESGWLHWALQGTSCCKRLLPMSWTWLQWKLCTYIPPCYTPHYHGPWASFCWRFHIGSSTRICRLCKSLYGLKQSAQQWNKKLHSVLTEMGFSCIESDRSVYVYCNEEVRIIVPIYIDDITLALKSPVAIDKYVQLLSQHFKCRDLGPTHFLLGVAVERDRSTCKLKLHQHQFILDLLEKYGMSDCKPVMCD